MRPIFSIIEKYQKYAMGETDLSEREKKIFNEVLLEPFKLQSSALEDDKDEENRNRNIQ